MKLVSLNCGMPREVVWHNQTATTSIFKSPVQGRVALRTLNLGGDRQSDLTVHGGPYKAVYCYPIQHYAYWRAELPGHPLPMGAFGENFTIEDGADEETAYIGDRYSIGSAEVVISQPRLPCYKLGIRFGSDDMVRRFLLSGRTGFYLSVAREGEVGAGDEFQLLNRDPHGISVSIITRLYIAHNYTDDDRRLIDAARSLDALPDSWKQWLYERAHRHSA